MPLIANCCEPYAKTIDIDRVRDYNDFVRINENGGLMTVKVWTKCSCGHIAQDHGHSGECAIKFTCAKCGMDQSCKCKGYDGELKEINNLGGK